MLGVFLFFSVWGKVQGRACDSGRGYLGEILGIAHIAILSIIVDEAETLLLLVLPVTLLIHGGSVHFVVVRPRGTDPGIVPPGMEVAGLSVLSGLSATPPNEEEAAYGKCTQQNHESQDRECDHQSQVYPRTTGRGWVDKVYR